MKILVWDTETTGIPLYNENGVKVPSDDPRQPHPVQVAAKLIDVGDNYEKREVIAEMSRIVKPDGYEISDFIGKLTGITQERAMKEGMPEKAVMEEYVGLCALADVCVAHNDSFDRKIIRISLIRLFGRDVANEWYCKAGRGFFCTMKASTDICKIPPTKKMSSAGYNKFKSPKLEEAYEFFFKKKPDVCHDAMADVNSTIEVFFALIGVGVKVDPRYFTNEEKATPITNPVTGTPEPQRGVPPEEPLF